MNRWEPFGYIRRPSVYGNGGAEGLEFIRYVDGREPQINKVWSFGDNDVTHEFHLTAQIYVGAGVVGEFLSDYLTESGRRIPILGRISINGSVEWLAITALHRTS